ncbi:response regulator [Inquilinus sp.]|jgi:CheY-like chemotaxis protein|uniref:response regulator n=1 Tax=Inquilinus sp. TaxID=1932117 RepID=UPI003784BC8D
MFALIAEDEPMIQMVAAQTTAELGYHVEVAASGDDALTVAETTRQVDLLFTDISLANGMSGWELANSVAQSHPGIAVVYTSGQATAAEFEERGMANSVWLPKPYSPGELQSAIKDAMQQAAMSPRH